LLLAFGAALAGIAMWAEQSGGKIDSGNVTTPRYHSYGFEAACGASVFRVRFRNGLKGGSRVDHVLIDGRPVPGVAETLDRFAAGRKIDRIEIMHCGMDEQRPLFRGIIVLSKAESQPASRQNELFFRLIRQGKGWRFAAD
jgi:hypothetical protein